MKYFICTTSGAIGAAVAYAFGGWDLSIAALLLFILIDYVTGLMVAGIFKRSSKTETGGLQSNAGIKGLCKKFTMLLFVIISNMLDKQLGSSYVRDLVCIAFMSNELISIVENAGIMGVPIPKPITNAIDILKKKSSEEQKNDN